MHVASEEHQKWLAIFDGISGLASRVQWFLDHCSIVRQCLMDFALYDSDIAEALLASSLSSSFCMDNVDCFHSSLSADHPLCSTIKESLHSINCLEERLHALECRPVWSSLPASNRATDLRAHIKLTNLCPSPVLLNRLMLLEYRVDMWHYFNAPDSKA